MRVLLTGASSLLGSQVVRQLTARGDHVSTLQRRPTDVAAELGLTEHLGDINDAALVAEAVEGVDSVIHLAARVGVVGSREQFFQTNVVGTRTLLAAARAAGVSRFVFVSSPSVAHTGEALAGNGAEPAYPRHAKGQYSRSKALAEVEVLAADAPGFATIAVRPHLVWGPGDTQLVGRIVDRAKTGRLGLVSGGRALIDTTYIDNAADALVAAVDHIDAGHGRAFIVSNGQPRTVEEMIERICAAAGVPGPSLTVPQPVAWAGGAVAEAAWRLARRTDDPPMTRFLAGQLGTAHWFDLRETERVLQWRPRVDLDEGFERLSSYYATHP
ncbi:MAG: NAD-dependent epimerase/dehydratase family protein [Actinobacteria bacterium]|jgi:nucleoside-diphosphate-sugar epimerase|nr:NAD-dependent epimerase/dehydratase family protein [Micrococcales bacterium]MCB9430056.1 NAD-dependent epimerase/dehydratase family protein [Actinomycetota bacterium]MCO5300207.1 NAD-dependent epimerase/dehydratase family protein [Candidatus Nanopelagicales bacterium]HPE12916.1 NAD-dependent epimerase/dehydratase family protein [Actinomycetota bacterium]HPJ18915.1 NAD-dependent epimerase/dehydratase family protein [Actinomycetota bacterium]